MLAAAPITWGVCELPGWGEVPPYRQVLDEIAASGFSGTELGPVGFLPEDPAALRGELHARALQLAGAFCPLPLHASDGGRSAIDDAVALARFLEAAGCGMLVASDGGDERRRDHAGRVGPEIGLDAPHWRRAGACLDELASRCADHGVRVSFHPHAGTYVETGAELDALMSATRDVGLCLDTGHLAYGGSDPVAVCRHYAERVWHVHVKDVSHAILRQVRDEALPYAEAVGRGVFTPLGDGSVDFRSLVWELSEHSYAGWWVLEQDVRLGAPWPEQDPAQNARRSADYLIGLLREGQQ